MRAVPTRARRDPEAAPAREASPAYPPARARRAALRASYALPATEAASGSRCGAIARVNARWCSPRASDQLLFSSPAPRRPKMLHAGDEAPNFTLETDRGKMVTLAELGDKPVVLFFYPKDHTSGCTVECKEFRDALPEFEGKAHV